MKPYALRNLMPMNTIARKIAEIALFSVAYGCMAGAAMAGNTVSKMLLVQDGTATNALIDIAEKPNFKSFVLAGPSRAVLDIDAVQPLEASALPAPNGMVLSVRQGKTATGIRLVFDLAQPATADSRVQFENGKARLVLALEPIARDPAAILSQTPVVKPVSESKPIVVASVPAAVRPVVTAPPSAAGSDEIRVQIEIDDSGTAAKTTVKSVPVTENPAPGKASASSAPKKGKTLSDVLGASERKLVIAIDAGHGGKDPGALGKNGLREKEVTLQVAKELAAAINADPGMKAVLIRDNDTFVPLQERYQRARRAQADLFVSIHADAALNDAANGSSVYVLSTKGASSQAARWLADKENAADLVGGVSLDDKDRNLSAVLLDLSQSATMRMSEDAAGNVLQSLKDLGKAHKKDVEHANFVVLRSPDVPSMLIETGFITNSDEERKLADPQHRKRLAFAIAQGLRGFFLEQPLPGTYYARKAVNGAPISASSGTIVP